MIGGVVYKSREMHFFTFQVGKVPKAPPGTEHVFSMEDEFTESPDEFFPKVRKEADRRGIGNVMNLPE